MVKTALILSEGNQTGREAKLGQILDFFGVYWATCESSKLFDQNCGQQRVLFGSAPMIAETMKGVSANNHCLESFAAIYTYPSDDLSATEGALQFLGAGKISLRRSGVDSIPIRISRESDLAGPMAGLEFQSQVRSEDAVVVASSEHSRFTADIWAGGHPIFIRFQHNETPAFFSASSYMVDLGQRVGPGFYDVKEHFCSVVPLVMFIRLMFQDVAWRPQELGACLIIDDPLLKQRYGSCDFGKLRNLMLQHKFTTNIAFIPWNWRRTSPAAGDFFRNESGRFSVSVHGCDHIGAEFGLTSADVLSDKAKLAQSRMRKHEARTGIHHDPIMIFPQGVFSSVCPEVLKRNGFLAAVNTETVPSDSQMAQTRIRDVWDVAIMTYGGFPIFTRRYAFHGVENFAFDLLLGKPCLIVSHHDFFKDGCVSLIELIEKLQALNCSLHWHPLGEVIRRACRRRASGVGVEEVEMYGNELLIHNPSDHAIEVQVRKREKQAALVAEVRCDQKLVNWSSEADQLVFDERIGPHSERHFQVFYREQYGAEKLDRSLRFELSVAARRILCEFRDDYVSGNDLLMSAASSLRNVLAKVS